MKLHRSQRAILSATFLFMASDVLAGASCVIAKRFGNSLDIAWVSDTIETAASATEKAKRRLLAKGYRSRNQDVFPQANTELSHAFAIIVKTDYQTVRGKTRTSYGCGFSGQSFHEAEWAALRDLQSYSWGWTPKNGYKIVEKFRY